MNSVTSGVSNTSAYIPKVKPQDQQQQNKGQSVTDSQTTTIRSVGELESLLKGGHSGRVIDMRTSNVSPEVWAALSRGEEVEVKLQQMAPERVNLFMPLVASIMQLVGGAQGAAYNKELGDAVKGHVDKAAEFVKKHGMSYSLNPFGGGQHIDVQAEFKVLTPQKYDTPQKPPENVVPPVQQTPRTNRTTRIPPKEEEKPPVRDIKTEIADILDSKEFKLLKTDGGYGTLFSWDEAAKSSDMSVNQLKSMLTNAGIDINTLTNKELYAVSFLQKYQPKHDDIVTNDGIGKLKGTYKDTTSGNTINSAVIMELDTPSAYVNSGKENTIAKGKAVRDYVMTALTSTEAFDNGLGFPKGEGVVNTISPSKMALAESVFSKYSPVNSPKALLDMADKFASEGKLDKAGEIYSALFLQVENNARGNDNKGVSNGHLGAGHYGALQESIIDRANIFVDGSRALNTIFNGGDKANLNQEEKEGLEKLIKLHNNLKGTDIKLSDITPQQAKDLLQFSKENLLAIKDNLESTGVKDAHPNLKALVGMIPNIIGSSEIKDGKGTGINALIEKLDPKTATQTPTPTNTTTQAFNLASDLSGAVSEINDFVMSKDTPKKPLNLTEGSKQALIKAGVTEEEISKIQSGDNTSIKSGLVKVESKLQEIKKSLPVEDQSKIDQVIGKASNGEDNSGVLGLIDIIDKTPSNASTAPKVEQTPSQITPEEKGKAYVSTLISSINNATEQVLKDPSAKIDGLPPLEFAKKIKSDLADFTKNNPGVITGDQNDEISKALMNLKAKSGGYTEIAEASVAIDKGEATAETGRSESSRRVQAHFKDLGIDLSNHNLAEVESKFPGAAKVAHFLNGNPPDFNQLKDIKPEDIQEAKELFNLDNKTVKAIEFAKNRVDTHTQVSETIRNGSMSDLKSLASNLVQQPEETRGRKIGEHLNRFIAAYENPQNTTAERIIHSSRLRDYTNIFKDGHITREKFENFFTKGENIKALFSEISSGKANIADIAEKIATELNLDEENKLNFISSITSMTPSQIEDTIRTFNATNPTPPRSNRERGTRTDEHTDEGNITDNNSGFNTNSISGSDGTNEEVNGLTPVTSQDIDNAFVSYFGDPREFNLSKDPSTAASAMRLMSSSQNVSSLINFDKDVFTREELNSVQGRNEFLKGFNKEFGEIMAREYQEAAAEAEVSQSSNETITEDELGAAANDSIRKADEMEAVAAQLDQFDPSAASIDKLLESLREIVKNLDKDVIEIISKVRRKDKQDKKTETNAVDNKSTRELLNTLKSQLKETHEKSPEEQKALASKLSTTVKGMSKQLKSEAEYLRDKQREIGNDTIYAINYRPERLPSLA